MHAAKRRGGAHAVEWNMNTAGQLFIRVMLASWWIRGRLYAATYGTGTFVAIGESTSLLTSSDGFMTWTTQRFPPGVSYYFSDVIWAGGLFAACANGGILLTSPDGTNWTPHVTGAETIQSLGYRQGQFVGVGHEGSIIQSENILVTMFGQRSLHPPAFELTISGGIERPHRLQASVVLPGSNWVDLLMVFGVSAFNTVVSRKQKGRISKM